MSSALSYQNTLTKLIKGAGTTFVGRILGGGLNYLYGIMLARFLGAELLGIYFLGFTVSNIAGVAAKLGLDNGTLRFASLYRGENDLRRVKGVIILCLRASAVSSLVTAAFLFFGSGYIANELFHKPELVWVIRVFSVSLPFWTLMMIGLFSTQAFQVMKYNVYVQHMVVPTSIILLTAMFFGLGSGLSGAIWAYVISMFLGMCLSLHFLSRVFPEIRSRLPATTEPGKLIRYSIPLLFVGILNFSLLWTDILMLGYFSTSSVVGIYTAAVKTALLTIIFLTAFNSIFAPIMSDLFNKKEISRLEKLFKTVTKWIFSFAFPFFLLIVLLSREVLSFFGPEFVTGSVCLIILCLAQLVNAGTGSVGYMLTMSGKQNIALCNEIFAVVLNVILNILFIPKWGMIGAAIATGISLSMINILALIEVYWFYRIHPYNREFLKPLCAGIIAFFVMVFLKFQLISFGNIVTVISTAILFLVVDMAILYWLRLSEEDQLILNRILNRLKPQRNYS